MNTLKLKYDDVWIVIPVYNESEKILEVLEELSNFFKNIIVIDDGSTDNAFTTLSLVSDKITILKHIVNLGQGASLQTGIDYAIKDGARFIITFDSDGQHQIKDALALINKIDSDEPKVICGSRFLNNNKNISMPVSKKIILKIAVVFTKFITGMNVTDAHNGLRLLTVAAAKKINITQNRMSHATEIILQIKKHKIIYEELPVDILYTEYSIKKGQKFYNLFNILIDIFLSKITK